MREKQNMSTNMKGEYVGTINQSQDSLHWHTVQLKWDCLKFIIIVCLSKKDCATFIFVAFISSLIVNWTVPYCELGRIENWAV